jgi:putative CRISPR-associated protein (TIGR02619 family)
MKHVITLVGTSLITNYLKVNKEDTTVKNLHDRYSHKQASEYEINKDDITLMKKKLQKFAADKSRASADKSWASAEIKSVYKIKEELKEDLSIHLLSSDTVNSVICAEVIACSINNLLETHFTLKDVINGLQVKDSKAFSEMGMENLFRRIEQIAGGYYGNVIMNITGGYKAAIPILTIFSQVNHIPSYYIFEDAEALMKIPLLPISVDLEIFKEYSFIFEETENSGGCVGNWHVLTGRIKPEHKEQILACFEIDGDYADLSIFGKLLWHEYKRRQYTYYQNAKVKDAIENDPEYKNYLMKLFDKNLRDSKTQNKNGHLVLDLGRTAPRIFYRIKDESIYVYNYMRHDKDYERFINTSTFQDLAEYGTFELKTLTR